MKNLDDPKYAKAIAYTDGKYKYKKIYDEELYAHMALGYSYTSFAGRIGVTIYQLYNWEKKYPSWLAAKHRGEAARLFKHEETIVKQSDGRVRGSTDAIKFILKNQVDELAWQDKIQSEVNATVTNAPEVELDFANRPSPFKDHSSQS